MRISLIEVEGENLGISVGQFHLIMMLMALAFRFNSRYADAQTSRKLASWDQSLRKLAGAKAVSA